jgi:hypothetical protein
MQKQLLKAPFAIKLFFMSRNLPGLSPGYKLYKRPAESSKTLEEPPVPVNAIHCTCPHCQEAFDIEPPQNTFIQSKLQIMNIKDYLHLYLGCELKDTETNHILPLNPFNLMAGAINWTTTKPILRPLSDMREEEARYFAWLCNDSKHHLDSETRISQEEVDIELAKADGGNLLDADIEIYIGVTVRCFEGAIIIRKDGSIVIEHQDGKTEPIDDMAEKIRFLLSKHFDLFGLIEAGIAVDQSSHLESKYLAATESKGRVRSVAGDEFKKTFK